MRIAQVQVKSDLSAGRSQLPRCEARGSAHGERRHLERIGYFIGAVIADVIGSIDQYTVGAVTCGKDNAIAIIAGIVWVGVKRPVAVLRVIGGGVGDKIPI